MLNWNKIRGRKDDDEEEKTTNVVSNNSSLDWDTIRGRNKDNKTSSKTTIEETNNTSSNQTIRNLNQLNSNSNLHNKNASYMKQNTKKQETTSTSENALKTAVANFNNSKKLADNSSSNISTISKANSVSNASTQPTRTSAKNAKESADTFMGGVASKTLIPSAIKLVKNAKEEVTARNEHLSNEMSNIVNDTEKNTLQKTVGIMTSVAKEGIDAIQDLKRAGVDEISSNFIYNVSNLLTGEPINIQTKDKSIYTNSEKNRKKSTSQINEDVNKMLYKYNDDGEYNNFKNIGQITGSVYSTIRNVLLGNATNIPTSVIWGTSKASENYNETGTIASAETGFLEGYLFDKLLNTDSSNLVPIGEKATSKLSKNISSVLTKSGVVEEYAEPIANVIDTVLKTFTKSFVAGESTSIMGELTNEKKENYSSENYTNLFKQITFSNIFSSAIIAGLQGYSAFKFQFSVKNATQEDVVSAYKILGVDKNATEKEIKSAYRKLMKEYHPDKYIQATAEEQQYARDMTVNIVNAYESLTEGKVFNYTPVEGYNPTEVINNITVSKTGENQVEVTVPTNKIQENLGIVTDYNVTTFKDNNIVNTYKVSGQAIKNINDSLNVSPAVVKINDNNFVVIDKNTGVQLDTIKQTQEEAITSYNKKVTNMSDESVSKINNQIKTAQEKLEAKKQSLIEYVNSIDEIPEQVKQNLITAIENTEAINTDSELKNINKIREDYSKSEISQSNNVNVFKNSISNEREADNGNTQSRKENTNKNNVGISSNNVTEISEKANQGLQNYKSKIQKDNSNYNITVANELTDTEKAVKEQFENDWSQEVVFYNESEETAREFVLPETKDVIYVKAGQDDDYLVKFSTAHGYLHNLKKDFPEEYQKLADVLKESLTIDQLSEYINSYGNDTKDFEDLNEVELQDYMTEEILADYLGNFANNPDFWNRFKVELPTIYDELYSYVDELIRKYKGNSLKQVAEYSVFGSKEQRQKVLDKYTEVLNNIKNKLSDNISINSKIKSIIKNNFGFDEETATSISEKINADEINSIDDVYKAFDDYREVTLNPSDSEIDTINSILKQIKKTKLDVSSIKNSITDYNDYRKSNFGKLNIGNDGISVDTFYKELASQYPEYFDSSITNIEDELNAITDFVNDTSNKYKTGDKYTLTNEDLEDVANEILETLGIEKQNKLEKSNTDENVEKAKEIVKYNQDGREITDKDYVEFLANRYLDNKNISGIETDTKYVEAISNKSQKEIINDLYSKIEETQFTTHKKLLNEKGNLTEVNLNLEISKTGISESLHKSVSDEKISIIPYLDKLIKTSNNGIIKPEAKERRNIIEWYYLYNTALINNELYGVKIDIKKTNSGDRFYVHRVNIIKRGDKDFVYGVGSSVEEKSKFPLNNNSISQTEKNVKTTEKSKTLKATKDSTNGGLTKLKATEKIEDFGEKIGGARKDLSETRGSNKTTKEVIHDYTVTNTDNGYAVNFKGKVLKDGFSSETEAEKYITDFKDSIKSNLATIREYKNGDETEYLLYIKNSRTLRDTYAGKKFKNKEDAENYAMALSMYLKEYGKNLFRPQIQKIDRINPTLKNNTKATGNNILENFGFRGGEFGNWVTNNERQEFLNYAYNAFNDLAMAMNVDPKDLGQNGQMSIAFGARGKGLTGAVAHFEPWKKVINMTRLKGAGSLAHEYGHSIDNWISRISEYDENGMATTNIRQGKLSDNMKKALKAVVDSIQYSISTDETEVKKKNAVYENARKQHLQYYLSSLDKLFDGERTTYKYNRKTKKYDTVKIEVTSEQKKKYNQIKKVLEAGKVTGDFTYKPNSFRESDRVYPKVIEDLRNLYKEVKGRKISDDDLYWIYRYSKPAQQVTEVKSESAFSKSAKELDNATGRKAVYFSDIKEMWARAFESYISDKLKEKGIINTYLVHSVNNSEYALFNPFPAGEERKTINKAFDNLIKTMKDEGYLHTPNENTKYSKRELQDDKPYTVIYNSDGSFDRIKINENIFTDNSKSIRNTIKEYLEKHIGEYADIIESGQRVYLGKDLPNEYTHSKNSESLSTQRILAKGRAVSGIKEIISTATNRQWKANNKEKHSIDAKYGFYKYDTKFSFNINNKEYIYSGKILIRNDANGKKYLYDILNIKKISDRILPTIASTSDEVSNDVGSRTTLINDSISQNEKNINGTKYSKRELGERQEVEPFYSQLENTIANKMQASATADSVLNLIKNNGIKQDELNWTGIEDYLKEKGTEKVTKQEIQDYIKANQLNMVDRINKDLSYDDKVKIESFGDKIQNILNNYQISIVYNNARIYFYDNDDENMNDLVAQNAEKFTDDLTDFLLNSEEDSMNEEPISLEREKEIRKDAETITEYVKKSNKILDNFNKIPRYNTYKLNGGENYREVLFTIPTSETQKRNIRNYYSPHWQEDNVIAHTRLQDFKDKEGNKVLFVDEIQSDMHQEGRKKGYLSDDELNETSNLNIRSRINNKYPFKKNWQEFVLRKIINEAVQQGYDKVAWTTGNQQIQRYDLSKQIDGITYLKSEDGKYSIVAFKENDFGETTPVIEKTNLTENSLTELVGQDIAKKIINSSKEKDTIDAKDLTVGGEGMRGFYDKIIPDYLNKYLKKWNSKVEPVEIYHNDSGKFTKQQGFKITDEMRNSIKKNGQPLYSKRNLGERSFYSNVYNTPDTPDEMRKEMKKNKKEYLYRPISNETTLENANKIIKDNENAKNEFIANPLNSAEDTAIGELLIKKAIANGDYKEANELTSILAEKLTTAGQIIQSASMFKRMTSEGMLLFYQKQKNKLDKELSKKIGKTYKPEEIDIETIQFINDRMKKVEDYEALKNDLEKANDYHNWERADRQQEIYIAQIMSKLGENIPSNMLSKLASWRNISLLLNPKTIVRNILSNAIFSSLENVTDVLATGIDVGISKVTGQRSTKLPNLKTQQKAFGKGWKYAVQDTKMDISTSLGGNKYKVNNNHAFNNKVMRTLESASLFGVEGTDRPFMVAKYEDSLRRIMELNGKTYGKDFPTAEEKEQALNEANYTTFKNDNVYSSVFSKIKNTINLGKPIGLADALGLTYTNVPGSLLEKAVDYSPAGVIKVLNSYKKYRQAKKNDKDSREYQRETVKYLSRALIGTGILAVSMKAVQKGILTGASDDNDKVSGLLTSMGQEEYALNISSLGRFLTGKDTAMQQGDLYITYSNFEPLSSTISAGADMYASIKEGGNIADATTEGVKAFINTLMELSTLSTVSNLFEYGNLGGALAKTLMQFPASFIPTFSKQLAQFIEPNSKTTYSDSEMRMYLINQLKLRIPGAYSTLNTKYDTFGNDVESFNGSKGLSRVYNVFINPSFTSTVNSTEVQDEVYRLYQQTGSTDHLPKSVSKSFSYKGQKITLTADERTEYQKQLGEQTAEKFESVMKTTEYKELSDSEKVSKLKSIIDEIDTKVKGDVVLEPRGLAYNTEFSLSNSTISNYGWKLDITDEMELEYEKIATEKYNEYKKQGLMTEDKSKSSAKDYAKSYMLNKYKDKLYRSK
jgi:hypothetical protein